MTHEKHCPYWRGGDPGTTTMGCGYCNAIRAAVSEERTRFLVVVSKAEDRCIDIGTCRCCSNAIREQP